MVYVADPAENSWRNGILFVDAKDHPNADWCVSTMGVSEGWVPDNPDGTLTPATFGAKTTW